MQGNPTPSLEMAGPDWTEITNTINKALTETGSPDWTDIVSALSTIFIGIGTLIISWAAISINRRLLRLEQDRFLHERFDKRMELHKEYSSFYHNTLNYATKDDKDHYLGIVLAAKRKDYAPHAQHYFNNDTNKAINCMVDCCSKLITIAQSNKLTAAQRFTTTLQIVQSELGDPIPIKTSSEYNISLSELNEAWDKASSLMIKEINGCK
jgi:hypothetical protein